MAPVYRALREGPLSPIVAVTAQHREMLIKSSNFSRSLWIMI